MPKTRSEKHAEKLSSEVFGKAGAPKEAKANADEAASMVGGPGDPITASGVEPSPSSSSEPSPSASSSSNPANPDLPLPASSSANLDPSNDPETSHTPIETLAKTFTNQAELLAYTRQLEQERFARVSQSPQPVAKPAASAPVVDDEEGIETMLITNPRKAMDIQRQKILEEVRQERAREAKEREYWDQFYAQNQDLAPQKELVQYTMWKSYGELQAMTPEQAFKVLARKSREEASRMRGEATRTTVVGNGSTTTAGVSGSPVAKPAPAPKRSMTFVEELQSRRKA
jgi:hypothetical protein